jgi:ferredoxin-NADP reductase
MTTDLISTTSSTKNGLNSVMVSRRNEIIETIPLGDHMMIGRDACAEIQLEDTTLSRVHAMIRTENHRWFLVDLHSLNGTLLNGRKITPMQPTTVVSGDTVKLGEYTLKFQLESPPDGTAATPPQAAAPEKELPPAAGPLLENLVNRHHEIPLWTKGEVQLKVADMIDETDDVKTYRLVGLSPVLFSFKPGQFVTLKVNINGTDVRRSYTISSSPSRPHCLEITIKRTPQGLLSNWMHDHVKLGDHLSVYGPSGMFSCFNYPSRKILFIGAGSGITPVMAMLRWIADTAADVDTRLLVSAKSPREIIFKNELNWISSRHSGIRVGITCTSRVTGADAWTGFTGRCDERMLKLFAPDILERHIFMCGPQPFMEAVKQTLKAMDFPLANLHTESFGEGRVAGGEKVDARDAVKPSAAAAPSADRTPAEAPKTAAFQVNFTRSGKTVTTTGDASLLELAEANGIEIDYACRSGVCGTCKTKLNRGKVDMTENELSEEEKADGFIYPCVAHPVSDIEIEA